MTTVPEAARRLHPASILFRMAQQVRAFAIPALLAIFGARQGFVGAEFIALWMLLPFALVSLLRYGFFSYRTAEHELEVRSGLLFRNVRHVPYSRIHDLTAVQNVFHRLLGVVEARVETGAGNKPEATLSVVSLAEYEALRALVFARRAGADQETAVDVAESDEAGTTLVRLAPRELALWGLLRGQVGVVLAALFGTAWQFTDPAGLGDRFGRFLPGFLRDAVDGPRLPFDRLSIDRAWFDHPSFARVLLALGLLVGLLLALRLLSAAWAVVRFYGFRLSLVGEDVKTEFGLLTRVSASLPRHRIQAIAVRESPLQRRLVRLSVRAQTAGGGSGDEVDGETGQHSAESKSLKDREWLAPILHRSELPALLGALLPGVDLPAAAWQPVDPRAVRRAMKSWLRFLIVPTLVAIPFFRLWTPLVILPLFAWAWFAARGEIAGLHWAIDDQRLLVRSGWLWRRLTLVPFDRIQAVVVRSSPWDRRAGMASVHIDTAGSGNLGQALEIPYLESSVASELATHLEREAAASRFRW